MSTSESGSDSETLAVRRSRSSQSQFLFKYSVLWNSLPSSLTSSHLSLPDFKAGLRLHYSSVRRSRSADMARRRTATATGCSRMPSENNSDVRSVSRDREHESQPANARRSKKSAKRAQSQRDHDVARSEEERRRDHHDHSGREEVQDSQRRSRTRARSVEVPDCGDRVGRNAHCHRPASSSPESSSWSSHDGTDSDSESEHRSDGDFVSGDEHDGDFDPKCLVDEQIWSPPRAMADYLAKHCRVSLSQGERRNIRKMCPRPDVDETKCPKIDPFIQDLPGLQAAKRADKSLMGMQYRVTDVLRPLAALWSAIEKGRPRKELLELTQMAIVMTGDASNVMSETRRRRLLSALPKQCPRSILKEVKPTGDLLFGDGFTRQFKKRSQEMEAFSSKSGHQERVARGRSRGGYQSRQNFSGGKHRFEHSRYQRRFTPYADRRYDGTHGHSSFSGSQSKNGQSRPFRGRTRGR